MSLTPASHLLRDLFGLNFDGYGDDEATSSRKAARNRIGLGTNGDDNVTRRDSQLPGDLVTKHVLLILGERFHGLADDIHLHVDGFYHRCDVGRRVIAPVGKRRIDFTTVVIERVLAAVALGRCRGMRIDKPDEAVAVAAGFAEGLVTACRHLAPAAIIWHFMTIVCQSVGPIAVAVERVLTVVAARFTVSVKVDKPDEAVAIATGFAKGTVTARRLLRQHVSAGATCPKYVRASNLSQ